VKILPKLSLCLTLSVICLPAFAFTPFNTLQQQIANCPALDTLLFTPANSTITHGEGRVTSGKNGLVFTSDKVKAPAEVDSKGMLDYVFLRQDNGIYGYQSGRVVTCFYLYRTFTGVESRLNLVGK